MNNVAKIAGHGAYGNIPSTSIRSGFFVGQRVWSIAFGAGEVVAIFNDGDDTLTRNYPVRVKFNEDDFSVVAFTAAGHWLHGTSDPKMDIRALAPKEDDHASLPVEWPGPISRFLFSAETVKARVILAYMIASAVLGGGMVAVVMQ